MEEPGVAIDDWDDGPIARATDTPVPPVTILWDRDDDALTRRDSAIQSAVARNPSSATATSGFASQAQSAPARRARNNNSHNHFRDA